MTGITVDGRRRSLGDDEADDEDDNCNVDALRIGGRVNHCDNFFPVKHVEATKAM